MMLTDASGGVSKAESIVFLSFYKGGLGRIFNAFKIPTIPL
jgi:hypothetical protein